MPKVEPEDLKIFEGDVRKVELETREWLRKAHSHVFITGRVLSAFNNHLTLIIFYRNEIS